MFYYQSIDQIILSNGKHKSYIKGISQSLYNRYRKFLICNQNNTIYLVSRSFKEKKVFFNKKKHKRFTNLIVNSF